MTWWRPGTGKPPAGANQATIKSGLAGRLLAANQGPGDVANYNAARASGQYQATSAPGGQRVTNLPAVSAYRSQTIQDLARGMSGQKPPAAPALTSTTPRSGGGGRGGGGGGGAAGLTQAQLDWIAQMLGAGRPGAQAATNLDLPDFQGQFDPSYFNTMRTGWNQALEQDRGTANQSTQNLINFLTTNYKNAFNNPNATYATAGQAPGMDQQAMARMLQGQGVDPSIMAAEAGARAGADQAFGNQWRSMAANEDMAQGNRLNNAQIANQDVMNRINAIGLQGTTGLNLGEAQARSQYDQQMQERNWQTAQQEAMENWQRQNQVSDLNSQNTNSYNNQLIQAMLGLIPQAGTATLPTLQSLGLA